MSTGTLLDLFSGLNGWSEPFADAGWHVVTLDNDPRFGADVQMDILDLDDSAGMGFDVILASPPCTCFSTMTFGHHWHPNRVPKTPEANTAMQVVRKTVKIIKVAEPKFWVVENPRAMLRKLDLVPGRPRTVWYCRYGERRAKPTDLWGGFPESWAPRPECHNGNPDHIQAPRGSRSGTQGGLDPATSAKIPWELADELRVAIEREMP